MGKGIVRVGDQNSAGGKVITGENSVFVNGKPVAIDNSPITPHPPNKGPHNNAKAIATEATVFANGKRLILVGDKDTCGHPHSEGSTDVSVG